MSTEQSETHHCEILDRISSLKIQVDLVYGWSLLVFDMKGKITDGMSVHFCPFCGVAFPQVVFRLSDIAAMPALRWFDPPTEKEKP